MELSDELKELYNHWRRHTLKPTSVGIDLKPLLNEAIYKNILVVINERMTIYENKEKGTSLPYTQDLILAKYRFCNIYRELDKQTIQIHKLLKPLTKDLDLWLLNMLFCRFICKTETISKVGLLSFDDKNNQEVYEKLMALPSPKYGSAYIFPISIIQKSEFNTREKFFCFYLPKIVKEITKELMKLNESSVVDALDIILPVFKFNFKFHFTEVLIDFAYQYPGHIDLFKRFPIGPGSIPTMKALNKDQDPEITCLDLVSTFPVDFKYLTIDNKTIYLSAENWEGIGCEYRKYTNLSNGNGRKRLFH